jgi:hypothetical protein
MAGLRNCPVPRERGIGRPSLRLLGIEDREVIATPDWQGKASCRESAAWFRMATDGVECPIMTHQEVLSNVPVTY